MKITFYALKPVAVGDEIRQPGDLVPEAQDWRYVSGYITDGKIAPVLVASLPEETQEMLLAWEEETYSPEAVAEAVEGGEPVADHHDQEEDESDDESEALADEAEAKRVVRRKAGTSNG